MNQPHTYDGRQGLQPEALAELRRAERVTLAVKNGRVAALGCWTPAPDDHKLALTGLILLDLEQTRRFRLHAPGPGGQRGVRLLLDIEHARGDERCNRALDLLRPGDVVRVTHYLDRRSAATTPRPSSRRARLNVFHGHELHAAVELLST